MKKTSHTGTSGSKIMILSMIMLMIFMAFPMVSAYGFGGEIIAKSYFANASYSTVVNNNTYNYGINGTGFYTNFTTASIGACANGGYNYSHYSTLNGIYTFVSSTKICNGLDGSAGADGVAGINGTDGANALNTTQFFNESATHWQLNNSWLDVFVKAYNYMTSWLIPDTSNGYLYNDSTNIFFNDTKLSEEYAPINYGDDWNKTYADTLYSPVGNDLHTLNWANITNKILNNALTLSGENITAGTIAFARLPTLTDTITLKWENITTRATNCSAGQYFNSIENMGFCSIPSGINNGHTHAMANLTGTTSYQAQAGQFLTNVTITNGVITGVNSTASAPTTKWLYQTTTNLATTNITAFNQTIFTMPVSAVTNYTIDCYLYGTSSGTGVGLQLNITSPASPTQFFVNWYAPAIVPASFNCNGVGNTCSQLSTTGIVAGNTFNMNAMLQNVNANNVTLTMKSEIAGTVTLISGSYCVLQEV